MYKVQIPWNSMFFINWLVVFMRPNLTIFSTTKHSMFFKALLVIPEQSQENP